LLDIEKSRQSIGDPNELRALWAARRGSLEARERSGVWRFRELLPFADDAQIVSLGEGNTPLYDAPRSAAYCGIDSLKLKHQGCNPTGSFKDTGMTTAVTQALILGARIVVCASTGNTAASLAAYAARADLPCAILVPHGQVSLNKLAQSLDYGATVLELDGNFDDAMRVIRELAEDESIYLVNSINPFRIEGQKTVAAELLEQLAWQVPDHVVVPGGNLGNSSAFGKGFVELFEIGLIERLPRLTVVQAEGAAPFAELFARHEDDLMNEETPTDFINVEHPVTLASAIKIGAPVSWQKAWRSIRWTNGNVLAVSEPEIADAKAIIGRDGIGCEPASATTVAGIKRLAASGVIQSGETVVGVLTGHLLKDTEYAINYHSDKLFKNHGPDAPARFGNHPVQVAATKDAILTSLRSLTS
jgi:threonine synthase